MISSSELRKQFIHFFIEKAHIFVKSSSVVPLDDPTLLFTNAGMNQFKDIFLGLRNTDIKRAVNSQKCIRAGGKHNDLEEVGKDGYHHTFFEMLGNWSFGDYYKKEAIQWAWELLTKVWQLPKEKLYATVHLTDNEAFQLWETETDIEKSHIEYHGDKDNFWEMGETGPCGPCSEIHIDRGIEFCNKRDEDGHICRVNGDCHRFIELWNLVFIQYNRDEAGQLHNLKNKFVDTGAGFERLAQVLQKKSSNYDTDIFAPILQAVEMLATEPYSPDDKGVSHRVIADHIRTLTFAISDGGIPSNEGRGYVLRRILRRAARHGRKIGLDKPFLHTLVDSVCTVMGEHYPEIIEHSAQTKRIIKAEEERFNQTLDYGLNKFAEMADQTKGLIAGKDAFMLYDTFGFPLDLTKILAEEKGLFVDETGFHEEMQKQQERARKAAKFKLNFTDEDWIFLAEDIPTEFVGYQQFSTECKVIKYQIDEKNVKFVLDKTPFYAESGGQVADVGKLYNENCELTIKDVQKQNEQFIHFAYLQSGEISNTSFTAIIESEYRKNVARNHTATHLLHKALKEILGNHIQQKGSLVNADYLRFDFTHFQQVTSRELRLAEQLVNRQIRACLPVTTDLKEIDEAKKAGAVALFGEKYGDVVRVVSVGDYSMELCGGSHVKNSGEIGFCKITAETSIAAGIRRLEAITGERAERFVQNLEDELEEIAKNLNAQRCSILERIQKITEENKQSQIEVQKHRSSASNSLLDKLVQNAENYNGVSIVKAKVHSVNPNELREMGDALKQKLKSGIGVLFSEDQGKVAILTIVTPDLTKHYHAGKIAGELAKIVGGKGGGRPDMAMAGGKDTDKIETALQNMISILTASLKQ
jgi:alanyl-tRNA synthetase